MKNLRQLLTSWEIQIISSQWKDPDLYTGSSWFHTNLICP